MSTGDGDSTGRPWEVTSWAWFNQILWFFKKGMKSEFLGELKWFFNIGICLKDMTRAFWGTRWPGRKHLLAGLLQEVVLPLDEHALSLVGRLGEAAAPRLEVFPLAGLCLHLAQVQRLLQLRTDVQRHMLGLDTKEAKGHVSTGCPPKQIPRLARVTHSVLSQTQREACCQAGTTSTRAKAEAGPGGKRGCVPLRTEPRQSVLVNDHQH